jgi:hypothetical protein
MTDEELAAIVDEYRHDDRSHMGEVLTALAQARRSAEAGDTYRLVVRELAELFGWSDRTPLHALMHVRNAVLNLRADLAAERVLRKKAEDRLAGYQSAPAHMAATVLKGRLRKTAQILIEAVGADGPMDAEAVADRAVEEIARIRARLSKCKFCGQDAAEGAGGHTSGCYERKLNKVRAALEIDDCTAMTDAIEEALNE